MERKLSVGETLSEVFDVYRDQAGVLLPVAFWLFLVVAIVNGLTEGNFSLFWLGIVVSLAVGTLYQGMVVELVRDVQDGRRYSSVGDLVRSVVPVLGPLIGAGVLAGLGIGGGFILLIVPGLILLTMWAVIAPVIVIERRGVFDAFGRSRHLVKGQGWPVFGTVVVAYLIGFLAEIVFLLIANSIADGAIVRIVFSALASTIAAPIAALVAAVLYYRLLAIKGQPTPAGPASVPQEPGDGLCRRSCGRVCRMAPGRWSRATGR
jgi:MFS family permease